MVSESQERMLAVVEPAKVDEVLAVCERWETGAAVVGEVTDTGDFRVLRDGEVVGEMPVAALVDDCPLYDLEPPGARPSGSTATTCDRRSAQTPGQTLLELLSRPPSIASKRWAFEQYDSIVALAHGPHGPRPPTPPCCTFPRRMRRSRSRSTATGAGSPAIPTRARSKRCSSAPQNLACVGAEPLGLTNCLNFGNPEKPHSRLAARPLDPGARRRLRGARGAGRRRQRLALQRDRRRADLPDPVVGMVGELPDPQRAGGLALAGGRRDRRLRAVLALAGRIGADQAARRARPGAAVAADRVGAGGDRRSSARRSGPGGCAPPTTSATAGSAARWRRWRSRAASGSRLDLDRAGRAARLLRRDGAVRRGSGGSCWPASEPSSRRWPPKRLLSTCSIVGPPGATGSRSLPPNPRSTCRLPTQPPPGVRSARPFRGVPWRADSGVIGCRCSPHGPDRHSR